MPRNDGRFTGDQEVPRWTWMGSNQHPSHQEPGPLGPRATMQVILQPASPRDVGHVRHVKSRLPKSGLRNPFYLHDSIWLRAETRMPQNQNSMGCHDFLRFMGYPHYTNPYQRNPYLMMPKPPWLMENMWISTNASPGDCNSGWFTESASHRQAKASNGLGGRENLKQNKGWPENHACRTM